MFSLAPRVIHRGTIFKLKRKECIKRKECSIERKGYANPSYVQISYNLQKELLVVPSRLITCSNPENFNIRNKPRETVNELTGLQNNVSKSLLMRSLEKNKYSHNLKICSLVFC